MSYGSRIRNSSQFTGVSTAPPPNASPWSRSTPIGEGRTEYLETEHADIVRNLRRDNWISVDRPKSARLGHLVELSKDLHRYVGPQVCIAGGSIVAGLLGKPEIASDIDLYTHSYSDFERTLNWLVSSGMYHVAEEDLKLLEERPQDVKFVQLRPDVNAISTRFSQWYLKSMDPCFFAKPVQLIKIFWHTSWVDVITSFDIRVCKFSIFDGTIYCSEGAYDDLMQKRLVVTGSLFPASLFRRVKKYMDKGFTPIDGSTIDDMLEEIGHECRVPASDEDWNTVLQSVREKGTAKLIDTGQPCWDNPQYRKDYYELDATEFQRKWEGKK